MKKIILASLMLIIMLSGLNATYAFDDIGREEGGDTGTATFVASGKLIERVTVTGAWSSSGYNEYDDYLNSYGEFDFSNNSLDDIGPFLFKYCTYSSNVSIDFYKYNVNTDNYEFVDGGTTSVWNASNNCFSSQFGGYGYDLADFYIKEYNTSSGLLLKYQVVLYDYPSSNFVRNGSYYQNVVVLNYTVGYVGSNSIVSIVSGGSPQRVQ